jgi:hypothetical protein
MTGPRITRRVLKKERIKNFIPDVKAKSAAFTRWKSVVRTHCDPPDQKSTDQFSAFLPSVWRWRKTNAVKFQPYKQVQQQPATKSNDGGFEVRPKTVRGT